MAKFTATLTIEIERHGGTKTVVSETSVMNAGDNPRFERSEAEEVSHRAMRTALHRVDPTFLGAVAR